MTHDQKMMALVIFLTIATLTFFFAFFFVVYLLNYDSRRQKKLDKLRAEQDKTLIDALKELKVMIVTIRNSASEPYINNKLNEVSRLITQVKEAFETKPVIK